MALVSRGVRGVCDGEEMLASGLRAALQVELAEWSRGNREPARCQRYQETIWSARV